MKIDFGRLIIMLLPASLRRALHIAWLYALIAPVRSLYARFLKYCSNNFYILSITPQVCFLEKMLNDRYDPVQHRIYISDGIYIPKKYIFQYLENKDVFLGELYINTSNELIEGEIDFIVHVPSDIIFDIHEMKVLIDSYKLASKKYSIITI